MEPLGKGTGNVLTSDRRRFTLSARVLETEPALGLGAPTIAWYTFLRFALQDATGLSSAPPFERIPFQGLFVFAHDSRRFMPLIILMLIPTLFSWLLLAKEVLHHRWKRVSWLIWLLNLVLVTYMSRLSYVELVSAGRLSTGLVLAMLFYGWNTRNTTFLWACQIYALTFPYYAFIILMMRN